MQSRHGASPRHGQARRPGTHPKQAWQVNACRIREDEASRQYWSGYSCLRSSSPTQWFRLSATITKTGTAPVIRPAFRPQQFRLGREFFQSLIVSMHTSDRPYRPALSDEEAVKILLQRRGNMYDPMVVDTFVRIRKELIASFEHTPLPVAKAIARAQQPDNTEPTSGPSLEADGLSLWNLLYQVLTDFADRSWDDAADLVMYRLSQVIPLSRAAVFAYDSASDALVCQSTHGSGLTSLRSMPRRLGEGLSGWVAANRRSIINSLPALDLADVCPEASSQLSSTLSVPLIVRDNLVGVLTVYATSEQAYNEHHRQVLEGVAPHVGVLLRRARVFISAAETTLPNYPNARHLDHYIRQRLQSRDQSPFALIVLQLDDLVSRRSDGSLLEQAAAFAAVNLRGGDLVFACGISTLVCLLADGDEGAAGQCANGCMTFPSCSPTASAGASAAVCLSFGDSSSASGRQYTCAATQCSGWVCDNIVRSLDFPETAKHKHG